MTGHYMYGCDYDHFRRLLAEHQADLDPVSYTHLPQDSADNIFPQKKAKSKYRG